MGSRLERKVVNPVHSEKNCRLNGREVSSKLVQDPYILGGKELRLQRAILLPLSR